MIPTEHTPRFLAGRAKSLLRMGLCAAGLSTAKLAESLGMDSDATAEQWAREHSDKHVPLWILGSPLLAPAVRATILAGLDEAYAAHRRADGHDCEGESNVVTGIIGNVLATIAGAMTDKRWSSTEARDALPFATRLLTHMETFVAMLSARAASEGVAFRMVMK